MSATLPFVVARTRSALESELNKLRELKQTVALVPTMGSLHDGHLSLLDRARSVCDETVVSIFVNRLQFGVGEDFDAYPRDLERDLERVAACGARLVFAPSEAVIYPAGEPRVHVDPGEMGSRLCGEFRPGHFRGVLTVVAKLFGLVRPDVAVFGRKDFQQCVLIRHMAEDLEQGVRIEVAPLIREPDGLAISSRNLYLSSPEREDALGISRGLFEAERLFQEGERSATSLLNAVGAVVSAHSGLRLQYVACVNPDTLDSVEHAEAGSVVAMAAFSGRTRLIDNVVLGDDASGRLAERSEIEVLRA